jgi:hypothetical protein
MLQGASPTPVRHAFEIVGRVSADYCERLTPLIRDIEHGSRFGDRAGIAKPLGQDSIET